MTPRILHVIPAIAPRYGGPSAATVGMCRALMAQGLSAAIATTDADGSGRLEVEIGDVRDYDGVPVQWFRRVASESFKWSPALARWLCAHVGEFDVVHAHAVFSHSTIAVASACRRARVPYLVRPLGALNPWGLRQHAARKRVLLALGLKTALRGAARIHYTAEEERRSAEQTLSWLPPGVVVPLGVDDEAFASTRDVARRENVVAAVGRLHPVKGFDLLIDAFHRLNPAISTRWRLVIAGDGERSYVDHLRRMARRGRAADRVDFIGWVDRRARKDLLGRARLFALASHEENFGMAIVEAMAAGVPVMVTPGVNLADDIARAGAGWTVDRSVDVWVSALGRVLADDAGLAAAAHAARQFADRFRWSQMASQLMALYENVVAESAREPAGAGAPTAVGDLLPGRRS